MRPLNLWVTKNLNYLTDQIFLYIPAAEGQMPHLFKLDTAGKILLVALEGEVGNEELLKIYHELKGLAVEIRLVRKADATVPIRYHHFVCSASQFVTSVIDAAVSVEYFITRKRPSRVVS